MGMRVTVMLLILLTIAVVAMAQDFDMDKFSNPAKYQWDDMAKRQAAQQDLLDRQKLLQLYQVNRLSVATNIGKSALIPGWGQFAAESYTKGQVFLGLEIVMIGTSLYFYDQSMESYDKYKAAKQIDEMNQYYNDSLQPYRFSQAFLGLAVAVWGYSLYDTYNETERYNAKTWQRILTEYNKKNLQITPAGVSWRF
jgi:hypothetical protein